MQHAKPFVLMAMFILALANAAHADGCWAQWVRRDDGTYQYLEYCSVTGAFMYYDTVTLTQPIPFQEIIAMVGRRRPGRRTKRTQLRGAKIAPFNR